MLQRRKVKKKKCPDCFIRQFYVVLQGLRASVCVCVLLSMCASNKKVCLNRTAGSWQCWFVRPEGCLHHTHTHACTHWEAGPHQRKVRCFTNTNHIKWLDTAQPLWRQVGIATDDETGLPSRNHTTHTIPICKNATTRALNQTAKHT